MRVNGGGVRSTASRNTGVVTGSASIAFVIGMAGNIAGGDYQL